MKKTIYIFIVAALAILLCSCSNENLNSKTTKEEASLTTDISNQTEPISKQIAEEQPFTKKTNFILGYKDYGFDDDNSDFIFADETAYYTITDDASFMISDVKYRNQNSSYIYSVHENGFVEINKASSNEETIYVPSIIDGYPVAYIGKNSFEKTNYKNVILPDGILAIGENAFSDSQLLEKITLPDSLIAISSNAFNGCNSLKDFTLPDNLQAIGKYAFFNCKSVKKVSFPKELRLIGYFAFNNCKNLSGDIRFNNKVKVICSGSFENTGIHSVVIPDSIIYVGACAFAYCEKLKSAEFPKVMGDADGFGWGMFAGCTGLEEVILPECITGIASNTFQDCKSLKSIRIPANVEVILSEVFNGCQSLKDIYFESKDCSIYFNSFLFTTGLTVHAPKGGSVEKFFKMRPLVKFEAIN